MAKKVKTTPRKHPQQDRAQATVEALLEATARVLVQEGYDRASTNRIAQAAGISIGSLYQYFPNKEALVAALVEQMIQEEVGLLESKFSQHQAEMPGAPLSALVRDLLEGMLAIHARNPKLRRIVIEQVPRVGRLERMLDVEAEVAKLVRANLESHAPKGLRVKDLEMAAFILVHAVESVIHAAVFKRPDYLQSRQLADELSELVLRYLGG